MPCSSFAVNFHIVVVHIVCCYVARFYIVAYFSIKFGFSEKATKFEKNLRRTFDKNVVFCALNNSVLVKKSTKIFFLKKCGQVVLYKL